MRILVFLINSYKNKNCLCGSIQKKKVSFMPVSLYHGQESRSLYTCSSPNPRYCRPPPILHNSPQLELVCINVRASAEMKGFTYLPTAHPGKSLLCKLLKRPMFLGSLITFLESRLPLLSLLDLSHPSFWLIYKCCQPDDSNEPGSPWKDTVHPYCSHNPLVLLVSWLS